MQYYSINKPIRNFLMNKRQYSYIEHVGVIVNNQSINSVNSNEGTYFAHDKNTFLFTRLK